ncbi:MAG: hypothetical protein IPM48_01300 [Saprospiraceae bacterium]|nr:hypothetical protein [Saprospiraceae bacterium]
MINLAISKNPIPKWINCKCISTKLAVVLLLVLQCFFHLKASPMDWPSIQLDHFPMEDKNNGSGMTLSCHGWVQISLDQQGNSVLTPGMLLTVKLPSYAQFKVYVNETGLNTLSCLDLGKYRTATVIDTTTGMSCWSELRIEDKLAPVLDCQNDTFPCTVDPYLVNYKNLISVLDNCDTGAVVKVGFIFNKWFCDPLFAGVSSVNYTVVDKSGNSTTCSKQVYFQKASLSDVIFPNDTIVYCPYFGPAILGEPTIFNQPINSFCDLFASYLDDTARVCGGMFKIHRRWVAMDWCTRMNRIDTQLITIADTTAPIVVCPPNLTLYAGTINCVGYWKVPNFLATDACSSPADLRYYVRIDDTYLRKPGDIVELSEGIHDIGYIAIDGCGLTDTCFATVTVLDKIAPTLICPPGLIIALDGSGQSTLSADYFRSIGYFYDNCEIDSVFIRRMTNRCGFPADTSFGPFIRFCCEDAGLKEFIVIKVTDKAGNANFCMINIEIQNKNVVNIVCPPDITLSCTQDRFDLAIAGEPSLSGACIDTVTNGITYSDSGTLGACKSGIILRKWRIEFQNGSVDSSCRQRLTIVNNYVFNPAGIIWARDTSLRACHPNHPDSIQSRPFIPLDSCQTVQFSWRDSMLTTPPDSCQRMLRMWTATSCLGMIARDTQILTLTNFGPIRLLGPRDTLYCSTADTCNPFLSLDLVSVLSCHENVDIVNDYNNNGANASDTYPLGVTRVIFTATDDCGNMTRDTVFIELVDKISPQVNCRLIDRNIQINDSAVIIARDLLLSFSDNCTRNEDIRITFTPGNYADTIRYISCSQHTQFPDSIWRFTVFVVDESDNSASCLGLVNVDDPMMFCTNFRRDSTIYVTGIVKDSKESPMENVEFRDLYGKSIFKTEKDGRFHFNHFQLGDEVKLYPVYEAGKWVDGISTQDIIYIQKHILGISEFENPLQWIAADVDRDGKVSVRDITWLRKLITGAANEVPGNTSWRFLSKNYQFEDPRFPLFENFEELLNIPRIDESKLIDFVSIKTGDVSSASGYQERITTGRIRHHEFRTGDHILVSGMRNISDFVVNDDMTIEGYQFSLKFDPLIGFPVKVLDMTEKVEGVEMDPQQYHIHDGELSISYNGLFPIRIQENQKVIRIIWEVFRNGSLKELIRNTDYRANEVYGGNTMAYPLYLRITPSEMAEPFWKNWKVNPNPFQDQFCIQCESNIGMECKLELMDLQGKLIHQSWKTLEKGLNYWCLTSEHLGDHQGMLIYKFSSGNLQKQGKLIRSKSK